MELRVELLGAGGRTGVFVCPFPIQRGKRVFSCVHSPFRGANRCLEEGKVSCRWAVGKVLLSHI